MSNASRFVGVCAGAIALCAGFASAQPDVKYSDMSGVSAYGPIGGIRAYMFGTYTCNTGTQNLLWTNDATPGVGMNAYRLLNGRLEQIGQSWVKTACCAAAGTSSLCGGTCNGSGGSVLGAGCLDVYSSGYNAIQGSMAARSGINAFTGTFPALTNPSFNAIDRRLQIAETDMNTAGALYFMEGVYVATDETTAAAKNNNCSYRRATIAAGTYAMALTDSTVVGVPAIKAWRLHGLGLNTPDPRVVDSVVDIPGDGRFHIAHKVTDLGSGMWRYEYAVFNQNCHRSGQALRIPVGGLTITNIGFKDVAYHSGEPFSGTDWAGAKIGDEMVWQSETFSQNANANALRWGTMYSFWFDAPSAPVDGQATLGLFRSGSPATVQFPVRVPQGTPRIPGDFNGVDGVTAQDIFDFISQWNIGHPSTDFNGMNGVTVQDLFDFLEAWRSNF